MTHNEFNYNVLTDIYKYLLDGDTAKLISQLRYTEKRIRSMYHFSDGYINFRFNGSPLLYSINQIETDLTNGTQSNRELMIETLIESVRLESELEILS